MQSAKRKVKEADDIAKQYWAVRDEAKRLEEHAKEVAGEAADEARDAQKKRVTVRCCMHSRGRMCGKQALCLQAAMQHAICMSLMFHGRIKFCVVVHSSSTMTVCLAPHPVHLQVERLAQKAKQAEDEAQKAREKKAQLEKEAQELAGVWRVESRWQRTGKQHAVCQNAQ